MPLILARHWLRGRERRRASAASRVARELDPDAPVRAVRARVAVLHRELHAVRDRVPLRRGDYWRPLRDNGAAEAAGLSRERLEARCAAVGARRDGAHVKGNLISRAVDSVIVSMRKEIGAGMRSVVWGYQRCARDVDVLTQ